MLNEFALVIYIVGGGPTDSYDYNTGFEVVKFDTKEQCEVVIEKMKEMKKVWHYGNDKKNIIPGHYSAECIELPSSKPETSTSSKQKHDLYDLKDVQPTPSKQLHRRWDDL